MLNRCAPTTGSNPVQALVFSVFGIQFLASFTYRTWEVVRKIFHVERKVPIVFGRGQRSFKFLRGKKPKIS